MKFGCIFSFILTFTNYKNRNFANLFQISNNRPLSDKVVFAFIRGRSFTRGFQYAENVALLRKENISLVAIDVLFYSSKMFDSAASVHCKS